MCVISGSAAPTLMVEAAGGEGVPLPAVEEHGRGVAGGWAVAS